MSTVFKNRWMALLWAAGIIWLALDYAGGASTSAAPARQARASSDTHLTDASGRPITADDLNEINGGAA